MSGECVYDLVAPDVTSPADGSTPPEAGRVTSLKSRKAPPPTGSTFGIHGTSSVVANLGGEFTEPSVHPAKKPLGTFGRSVGPTVDPANFLKKNTGPMTASRGAPTVNQMKFKKSEYHREKTKPDIPDRNDRPVMGLKTEKNYVVANAVENIMAIPTKSLPVAAPRPTDRANFGQTPQYITEIKEDLDTRKRMIEERNKEDQAAKERWSELPAAEVQRLCEGLQRRWDLLNKEYQSKGFSKLETPSQRAHQEVLEKQLCALEFAMQKLSRRHIFIYDDQM